MAVRDSTTAAGLTGLMILTPLAALPVAIIWGTLWISFHWLLGLILRPDEHQIIHVPALLDIGLMFAVAFVLSYPASWLLTRVPGRGRLTGGIAATIAVMVGVVLGDAIVTTWLIYRELGVILFEAGVQLLPRYWWEEGINSILRIVVIFGAVAIAVGKVSPKRNIEMVSVGDS